MFDLIVVVLLLIVGALISYLCWFVFGFSKQVRTEIEAVEQLKARREDVFRRLNEISLQGSPHAIALATSLRCVTVFLFIQLLEMQGWESEQWHPLVMQNLSKLPTDAQWWIDRVGMINMDPVGIVNWFIHT